MKKLLGFCILVILLVTISGCTQQAQPTQVTTTQTTVATMVATPEPTPIPTAIVTAAATAVPTQDIALLVVVKNVTTEVPTLIPTPRVSLIPQTKITTISITNNTFSPKELTVLPGTGITWRNDDTINHAVKGTTEAGATMFNSGDIIPTSTWSYTFGDRVGTFTVIDPGFPGMKCTIIVKEGSNFSGSF